MADPQHRPQLRMSNRAEVLGAALLVLVLLLVLAALMGVAFSEVRRTTGRFSTSAVTITDLANVQRELLALSRDMSRVSEGASGDDLDEVALRLGLLQTHWTSATRGVRSGEMVSGRQGETAMWALDNRMRAMMSQVQAALGSEDPAVQLALLNPQMDVLDTQLKSLYALEEVEYHGILRDALSGRGTTTTGILATVGMLLVAAVLLGAAVRRAARASMADARHELASIERRFEDLVGQVREAIVALDDDGRLSLVNPGWQRLTGCSVEESVGRPLTDFVDVPTDDELWPDDVDGGTQTISEAALVTGDGQTRWAEVSRRRRDNGWVVTLVDVTGRVAATRELTRQARHDSMTGLANRAHLVARLQEALEAEPITGLRAGLIFLDLDRFKLINDSMGHDFGDRLLQEVSVRLRGTIRGGDLACRLGGDEFVVLCANLDRDEAVALETVQQVADRVMAVLALPMTIGGREIRINASAGIAIGDVEQRPEALLAEADAAMYHAKDRGRARAEVFDSTLKSQIDDRMLIEQALRGVVDRGELEVWMQPVQDLRRAALDGFEALVRWRHPQWGLLPPARFLDVAEDTGDIHEIGLWVLQESCRRAAEWDRYGPSGLRVAVNVSPVQFTSGDLPTQVAEALRAAGLAPERLEVEITESVYLAADEPVLRQLQQLAALGVTIAMDDFGTGYSSLAALRDLPIDVVKLDRSFVSGIGERHMDEAIIQSTVAMAKATSLTIVGEGIERNEQLALLSKLGCDRGQGYLFSRPVPPGGERDVILKGVLGSLT